MLPSILEVLLQQRSASIARYSGRAQEPVSEEEQQQGNEQEGVNGLDSGVAACTLSSLFFPCSLSLTHLEPVPAKEHRFELIFWSNGYLNPG